jgi:ribonuclease BN (tRNA processing enzyme)
VHVRLLGTGAADGWPNPWCSCRSCTDARGRGESRRQTSVLVDGAVLLDLSPALPPDGVSLAAVHTVLVTHAHPDHCAPFALLWRHWVLPADHEVPTVLYDLTGPDGARLLYATDTGALPDAAVEAMTGAAFDVVLLEQTFGDKRDHDTRHLDLGTFPAQLDRLRCVGAVTQDTDVVAVHLGHHNPPAGVLAGRLAGHGARVLPDGAELQVGAYRRRSWNSDASAAPA